MKCRSIIVWSLTVAACLLLGGGVTVLTAWGFAAYAERPSVTLPTDLSPNYKVVGWPVPEVPGWPAAPRDIAVNRLGGNTMVMATAFSPDGSSHAAHVIESGWPWPAMAQAVYWVYGKGPPLRKPDDSLKAPQRWGIPAGRQLPMTVLPLGFALNTLLAATLLLAAVQLPLALRRRARRKRGRCLSCGYDRAGVAAEAACPECGKLRAA